MNIRRWLIRALAGLTVLASPGTWEQANAQQRTVEPPASAPHMSIAIDNGRITAAIRDTSLGSVLLELGARTGAVFVAADDIDVETLRLSAQLSGVPVDEGLRLLLRNFDVFFYYGAVGDGPASLRAAWIYRKGAAANLRPVPPEAWGSARDLRANLADPDPLVRARA